MTGKDLGYYALAALLFAASIPMYRYIIERGHAADQPAQSRPHVVAERTRPLVAPAPAISVTRPDLASSDSLRVECEDGRLYRFDGQRFVRAGSCPVVTGPSNAEGSPVSSAGPLAQ